MVVAGRTVDPDGKSDSGVRTISLDGFTVELLQSYLAVLDEEQEASTRRSSATGSGMPMRGITVQIYGHRSTGHDREAANWSPA